MLKQFGWNKFFRDSFKSYLKTSCVPGRISQEHNKFYRVATEKGELLATLRGKYRYRAKEQEKLPVVGDWVVVETRKSQGTAIIKDVLPRKNKLSRKLPGKQKREQILVANVDIVFLVQSLVNDFNIRRIERALSIINNENIKPVVLLNKKDLCADWEAKLNEVKSLMSNVDCYVICALNKNGFECLEQYLEIGKTITLLGSSGVGKSTIINSLCGKEIQRVQETRDKDEGRHTTTSREILLLPQGGVIIDTPGLRELEIWEVDAGIDDTFEDIVGIARKCYFRDCRHLAEPVCAVKKAVEDGRVDAARLLNYQKLKGFLLDT
jgi:ribosome biogenesis GTPase / thiamine phosphate phosphatase